MQHSRVVLLMGYVPFQLLIRRCKRMQLMSRLHLFYRLSRYAVNFPSYMTSNGKIINEWVGNYVDGSVLFWFNVPFRNLTARAKDNHKNLHQNSWCPGQIHRGTSWWNVSLNKWSQTTRTSWKQVTVLTKAEVAVRSREPVCPMNHFIEKGPPKHCWAVVGYNLGRAVCNIPYFLLLYDVLLEGYWVTLYHRSFLPVTSSTWSSTSLFRRLAIKPPVLQQCHRTHNVVCLSP